MMELETTSEKEGLTADLMKMVGQRVLIIGDVMLDKYSWCTASRISPEAPVPVAVLEDVTYAPGGASNVAANVVSLGGNASIYSILGADQSGQILEDILKDRGVNCQSLVKIPDHVTTVKNRIIAHSQQMLRLDHESIKQLNSTYEQQLLAEIEHGMAEADVCVISDYAKGVVTPKVAQTAIYYAKTQSVPVVADPKGRNYEKYRGATLITPNTRELCQALNCDFSEVDDVVSSRSKILREMLDTELVLTTRGSKGMSLLDADGTSSHIPVAARQVFDVTGAGDTVVAMMALALASGMEAKKAAFLTNVAAGIVVGKIGSATVTPSELLDFVSSNGMLQDRYK